MVLLEPYGQPISRSILGREFGIHNLNGSLNCFLNTALQALWQFSEVRSDLKRFCEMPRSGGCEEV
jgi:hypothetical protein